MPSDSGILVTVNGFDNITRAIEDAFQKVKAAAIKGVMISSDYHLNRAISNVNNAYTSAGYPKISFMYARYLAARNPAFKKSLPDDWDYTTENLTLDTIAEQIYRGKTAMISGLTTTGTSLLDGLHTEGLKDMGTTISRKVVSDAKYSDDLERGYLFGKYRGANKKRPFFTGHMTATKTVMIDEFKEELKRLDK